jgi:CRISPR/Cas system CSM-associated protein Csm3 (group 7 of RAMP superfamily)
MRGSLIFKDFIIRSTAMQYDTRNRISINEETGAVNKGAYMVIDAPFRTAEHVRCEGKILFFSDSDEKRVKIKDALKKALRWIPALGAQRSVGYGALIGVEIAEEVVPLTDAVHIAFSGDTLRLDLTPDEPFCIAKPRKADNLFESESFIPGAAIKGSIASTLKSILGIAHDKSLDSASNTLPHFWTELRKYFSQIRFTHAFPSPEGQKRPVQYPLSFVRAPKEKGSDEKRTYDVILCEKPGLINEKAPLFSIDWKPKDYEEVSREMAWCDFLKTDLRVRTKIEYEKRRADEGKLFAYEMVNPEGYVWHSSVDLSTVPTEDRKAVHAQLEKLLKSGIEYLGKTKASLHGSVCVESPPIVRNTDGLWIITLQTPALMLSPDPEKLNQALVNPNILHQAYNDFWLDISGNLLSMVRFFASQRLLGGYLRHRFQSGKPYNPFVVTSERSVFALKTTDEKNKDRVEKKLTEWLRQGLSLPKWAEEAYGKVTWQNCPFIRENGFGEIALNMDCHKNYQPKPTEFTEI